ncbi:MAG: glycine--tRNA ligase subunit beta [Hyphomonadaceae bacterium]|nr:glycine--tRNA ligase subunit beta [Hyphomonadaceae bacterium]
MPQLFIELFSEEIPARMQKRAEDDLARMLREKLNARGLAFAQLQTFSTPRRLGLCIEDCPDKAADVNEERKGPRVGAPEQAIQGFLKSAGLASIDQAEVVEDKKGAFYVARIERAGRATPEIVQEVLPEIIRSFPWPKSMRSGESDLQWVRPLHNICCTFDKRPVKIDVAGVPSEAKTWGHRFHDPAPIAVTSFEKWDSDLRSAKVVPFRADRRSYIEGCIEDECASRGLEWVRDEGLLEEVVGLVEWPRVIFGDMDPAFLDLPGEVIRLSMRTHQKYFAVRDPKTGKLAPHFIAVANVDAKDGGRAIAAGNARVLSARLNDARFFWDTDKKTPLFTEERKAKLEKIVFHQKLGSVWDKVERVKALAVELCDVTGADRALVERAAELCKMDLVTETVGEFPELQGQVGRQLYLAELASPSPLAGEGGVGGASGASSAKRAAVTPTPNPAPQGGGESIAAAIEDHYRPLGPNDRVPEDKVAVTLSLADKLDTLVGLWIIAGEKPTGSSDAFGLRRAALGSVRTILSNAVRVEMARAIDKALDQFDRTEGNLIAAGVNALSDVQEFFADRLKVQLRDQGKRHDLVDAVFALGDDDLVRIVARVEALDAFLKTEDGANLLAGYKRAANILAAEEKKGKGLSEADLASPIDAKLLGEPAEKALHEALEKALPAARAAVEKEEFGQAMKALAGLRSPVDAFFDKVLVNAPEEQVRRNRLLLLSRFREALSAVADFSKIEG